MTYSLHIVVDVIFPGASSLKISLAMVPPHVQQTKSSHPQLPKNLFTPKKTPPRVSVAPKFELSRRKMSTDSELDLAEAKALLEASTRPAVQALLRKFIEDGTQAALKPVDMNVEPMSDITAPAPTKIVPRPVTVPDAMNWIEPDYGWEQGEYNTPWLNIMLSLANVPKDKVECDFEPDKFDFKALDVDGKNYRLKIEALDKDIIPDESKIIVKKNRVTIKLKKVKGEYSYDHWTDLKKKGGKAAKDKEKQRKDDPTAGIMDMMKDLYDTGDDNMRKIIGESMLKSRRGEKTDAPTLDDPDPPTDWTDSSKMAPMPDFDD